MDSRWGRWVLEFLSRRVLGRTGTRRGRGRHRQVNRLEDRTLLAAFTVNTLLDTVDANPGDGLALDANGNTSLRAAVMEANALSGADTITLGAGVYQFSLAGTEVGDYSSGVGDLDITSQITIEGAGAGQTTIDANLLDRAFDLNAGAVFTLRGVTITRGQAGDGGAIRNRGSMGIENSTLTGNRATRRGGALESVDDVLQSFGGPMVRLTNVTFSANVAQDVTTGTIGTGGAIYFQSTMAALTNVTFSNNTAAVEGGAIYALQSIGGSELTINNSTLTGNTANYGGAIRLLANTSTTSVINDSTFSGNRAVFGGGGIRHTGGGTLTINRGDFDDNRTTYFTDWNGTLNGGALSLNSATVVNGTEFRNNSSWRGGAVYALSANVSLFNCLFENNSAVAPAGNGNPGRGGAVLVDSNAVVSAFNDTFVGNTADEGGALYALSTTRLSNATVAGNTTLAANNGAVQGNPFAASIVATNNIIAGNVGNKDIVGGVNSGGGNFIGVVGTTTGFGANDRIGTVASPLAALLGPLADNGGPVRTMAIAANSPARDIGFINGFVMNTDARGLARSGSKPDAGAYEYQNQAPTALVFTGGVTKHDQPLTGQLQGTDPDGDTLTFTAPYGPSAGTMVIQPNGQFTYTPPPNVPGGGQVLFDFFVTDGHGGTSAIVRSTIQVLPNLAPTATVFAGAGIEDEVFTGQLLATDPDGNSMTFEVASPYGGTVSTLLSGEFTFTPAPNFSGTAYFWMRAKDQYGAYSQWVLNSIELAPVNDAPVVADQSFSLPENSLISRSVGSIYWTDDGPAPYQMEILSGNEDGAFTLNGAEIRINRPELLDFETHPVFSFVVRMTDGEGLSDTATITINLEDVVVPRVAPGLYEIAENSANGTLLRSVSLLTSLEPGQTVTYSIESDPTGGGFAIDPVTGMLSVADGSRLNYEGNSWFVMYIRTTDNSDPSLYAVGAFQVSILNVNEAPVANAQTFSVHENAANGYVLGTIVSTDPDAGQTRTYALAASTLDGAFAISPTTGAITVADGSLLDHVSVASVTLTVIVTDNGSPALSTACDITVNVTEPNETPVTQNLSLSLNENSLTGTVVGTVVASDADAGQTLTYAITSSSLAGAFAIDSSTGVITIANGSLVNHELASSVSLVVTVSDNGATVLSASSLVTIAIANVEEAPVVPNYSFSVDENIPEYPVQGRTVGTVVATDEDLGQTLTYSITDASLPGAFAIHPTTGVITVADSSLLNYEAVTSATITVLVTDSGSPALSTSRQLTIAIRDKNEAPVIAATNLRVNENAPNGTSLGVVTATDPDFGQTLTYSITYDSSNGAFAINAVTGEVTVVNGSLLNREAAALQQIRVLVRDSGGVYPDAAARIFTIAIDDVNEAPVVSDRTFAITENSPTGFVVGTVTSTDVDAGQTRTYAITSSSLPGAFAINATTGQVTVANASLINHELTPSVQLTVTATDNGVPALSGSGVVTITIGNLNEAPVIANQAFSVAENSTNGTSVGTVVASDQDAGQTLTYAIVSGNTSGIFAINSTTGQITVANSSLLNFESVPSYSLVIRVTDNGTPVLFTDSTVTIAVQNVNEAPTITNQSFTVTENLANGTNVGTLASSDVDAGQILTYDIFASTAPGAFALNATTGQLTVADSSLLNYEARTSITMTVRVTDNGNPALSSLATVTITVLNVNEAPVVANQSFSVAENSAFGTIVGTVLATDQDVGQSRSYSINFGNFGGAFAINSVTGRITVANSAALNFEGISTYSLDVRVTDNGSPQLFSTAVVTVQLTNVNEAPTVTPATMTVVENPVLGNIIGFVVASDPDAGQTRNFEIVSSTLPGALVITPTTGAIAVGSSSLLNFEAMQSISLVVRVTDNGSPALSGVGTITVQVTNANDTPTTQSQVIVVPENTINGTVVGQVVAADEDAGQSLSYAISSEEHPGAFAVNPVTGEVTVSDSTQLNFEADSTQIVFVRVTDNGNPAKSALAMLTIQVTNVNDAPVVTDRTFTVHENSLLGTVVGSMATSDEDANQVLTYAITSSSLPGAFTIDAATGEVTVSDSSRLDFESATSATLVATATDNGNPAASSNSTLTVSILDVNDRPTIAAQNFTVAENSANGAVVGTVIASDVDAGQSLTYAITASAPYAGIYEINPTTGVITVAISSLLNFESLPGIALTVTVTDSGNPALSSSAVVVVTLTDVNEAPTIADQSFSIAENTLNTNRLGFVAGSDVDAGQSLTYAIASSSLPGAFVIDPTTGEVTVADDALLNFEAVTSATLVVTATDNGNPALSSDATLTIAITDVNERPVIADQSFTVAENAAVGTVVGTVVSSDVDAGQTRTYAITASAPISGAFAINATTGVITVVNGALLNYESISGVALTVTVTDSGNPALSSSAVVVVTLTDVNEAPTIGNQTFSVAENSVNGTIVGNVAASDVDAGQSLSYSIVSGNTGGAFSINATTGRITVANVAALNFESTPTFSLAVRVTDNGNPALSSTATVTINLTDVIEAIIIGLDVGPGDPSNTIKLNSKFDIAILSSATFDARTVNVSTIRFGKNGTEDSATRDKRGNRIYSYRDVNGDGRLDLVVNITTSKTGLGLTDTLAKVSGLTNSGLQILGSSSVLVRR